jgi:hypothetical protein
MTSTLVIVLKFPKCRLPIEAADHLKVKTCWFSNSMFSINLASVTEDLWKLLFQCVFRSFCAAEGKWELALKCLGSLSSPIQITAQILLNSSADDYRSRLAKDIVRILTSVSGEVSGNLSRVLYGLVPRSPRAQRPVLLTSSAPSNADFLILQSFSISNSKQIKKKHVWGRVGVYTRF